MRIVLILIGLLISQASFSDENVDMARIRGIVLDESASPVSGAVVSLESPSRADTTDTYGRFLFERLQPGRYLLSVKKDGSSFSQLQNKVTATTSPADPVVFILEQRTYTVDEVVVIGSNESSGDQQENSPSQVDIVTRSEFEVHAATVEDVIASTPSASISTYGGLGSFSEVSLRGSYSNQVQVYVDGMLLNESIGGSVNLGLIPLNNVDRVEIWRSGAPARFGGDAVGGAINIVTREYSENRQTISLGYGSFGTVTGHGVFGFGPKDSRLIVSLDAATSRNDYDYTSDNGTPQNPDDDYTTYRRNNDYRTVNGLVKYRRLIGSGMILEVSNHTMSSRKNLPNTQHILFSSASLKTSKNLLQSRFSWMPESLPFMEIAPTAHYIVSNEHYEDKDGHVGWGEQDNIYTTNTVKGMIPFSLRRAMFGSFTLTPVASRESYSPEHRLEKTIPLSSDREHLGLVGDFEMHSPGQAVTLTANMRRDRYYSEYEGQANVFSPEPPEPKYHHFTNRQTGIKIEPHPLVSFRWNYGDNWRVPSFYELFGDRGGIISKSGLKPEHVYRWDAGLRFHLPEWARSPEGRFDVVYFDNNYRDLIQWYTNNYGFIEPANVAGSYVRGTELIWNTRLFNSIGLRGNWTIQNSRVTDTTKSYHQDKQLPNRPKRYGTATLEYSRKNATLSWILDYKDSYYLDRSNQPHMKYPGRSLHDLSFSLGFKDNTMVWRFMVENVTDRNTFDMRGMPKPGRSYSIDIRYSL